MTDSETVITAVYQCPQCEATVEVADFYSRTAVGYTAATIRCGTKAHTDENGNAPAMERIG